MEMVKYASLRIKVVLPIHLPYAINIYSRSRVLQSIPMALVQLRTSHIQTRLKSTPSSVLFSLYHAFRMDGLHFPTSFLHVR